jgi:hypothetical protein
MTTGLVTSVTDKLVAELERQALERIQYQKEKQEKLNEGGRKETIVALCEILPNELLALLAERAELLRDAERYRWLRDKALISTETAPAILLVNDCCEPAVNGRGWQSAIYGKDADVYVDAAMQSEAKP